MDLSINNLMVFCRHYPSWKHVNLVIGLKFSMPFENQKRWFAAEKANVLGRGGIAKVMVLTGLSRNTIKRGMHKLESSKELDLDGQIRRREAGRKIATETNPELVNEIEKNQWIHCG